mmetsp:Transcript_126925/g.355472  ORF Transcript_126925/g.355472 Transcript_126925/m.355472 type:complete len:212 (+) Transcript_126925:26-661(+)
MQCANEYAASLRPLSERPGAARWARGPVCACRACKRYKTRSAKDSDTRKRWVANFSAAPTRATTTWRSPTATGVGAAASAAGKGRRPAGCGRGGTPRSAPSTGARTPGGSGARTASAPPAPAPPRPRNRGRPRRSGLDQDTAPGGCPPGPAGHSAGPSGPAAGASAWPGRRRCASAGGAPTPPRAPACSPRSRNLWAPRCWPGCGGPTGAT